MLSVGECKKDIPCVDCDEAKCIFHGKKEANCPKYHCDRPDPHKYECQRCGFIDHFIEEMRRNAEKK